MGVLLLHHIPNHDDDLDVDPNGILNISDDEPGPDVANDC